MVGRRAYRLLLEHGKIQRTGRNGNGRIPVATVNGNNRKKANASKGAACLCPGVCPLPCHHLCIILHGLCSYITYAFRVCVCLLLDVCRPSMSIHAVIYVTL